LKKSVHLYNCELILMTSPEEYLREAIKLFINLNKRATAFRDLRF